jgi:hypothetical protein
MRNRRKWSCQNSRTQKLPTNPGQRRKHCPEPQLQFFYKVDRHVQLDNGVPREGYRQKHETKAK